MGPKKKIMLVEDDTALAAVYRQRLEMDEYEVLEVQDGEQALAKALDFRPDLVLLDVMMPKISGFDVLDILKNTPEMGSTKIIMLTALGQEKDRERARSSGADDYLVKSQVSIGDVMEKVKSVLGEGIV